uniref:Putative secreted protein n=1 Tax=Ixodes scapularis TaxID=6945 RepID=A0A4D5RAY1_IXOSC
MVAAAVVVFVVAVAGTETGGDLGTTLRSHRTWCFACARHLRCRSEPDTCHFRLSIFFLLVSRHCDCQSRRRACGYDASFRLLCDTTSCAS